MRSRLIIAAFVLCSASLAAHDDKKYESATGKYKVVFPGKPDSETKKVEDGELNVTSYAMNGGGFLVIYTDLSAAKLKENKAKDLLASGEKGLVDSFKAKVKSSKDIEFGKQKFPAKEITAEAFLAKEAISIHIRLTLILADNRLYQILVFGPKELPAGEDADKFFKSFEITK
jgi:hypothetical protein